MTNTRLISVWAVTLFALLAVIVVGPEAAAAFEITGRVINGTTGEPVGPIKVSVVDPRHGMATEDEIETDAQGNFVAENLDDRISVFLLQVNYLGVTYTEFVRPEQPNVSVEVNVYETTTSWDGVDVSLPHFMGRRSHDTLSVDRLYLINNKSDPPRTVVGEGAGFRVMIPEERLQLTQLFVTSMGIPISVLPHPTDDTDIVTIDYAFQPGETRVGIAYEVDYATERYDYEESIQYDLAEVIVMTEDPSMEVSSEVLELPEPGESHGFRSYTFASLQRSSKLGITFRKGDPHLHGRVPVSQQQAGHQIVTLQSGWEQFTVIIIIGFALLLVLVAALGTKSTTDAASQVALMTAQRKRLVGQIARLDDLYETGTLTDQLYKGTRVDLVEKLARLIYKIDKLQPKKSRTAQPSRKRKGTASVK
jgi:hypothetical protein